MARKKLEKVPAYLKAQTRIASLASIDPNLDLGNGITLAIYQQTYNVFKDSLNTYNTLLSTVDEKYNTALAALAQLKDYNERVLAGVASKYGKNSSEYEQAGGVRKAERKKRKAKTNGGGQVG